jgi:hypothetical protein
MVLSLQEELSKLHHTIIIKLAFGCLEARYIIKVKENSYKLPLLTRPAISSMQYGEINGNYHVRCTQLLIVLSDIEMMILSLQN